MSGGSTPDTVDLDARARLETVGSSETVAPTPQEHYTRHRISTGACSFMSGKDSDYGVSDRQLRQTSKDTTITVPPDMLELENSPAAKASDRSLSINIKPVLQDDVCEVVSTVKDLDFGFSDLALPGKQATAGVRRTSEVGASSRAPQSGKLALSYDLGKLQIGYSGRLSFTAAEQKRSLKLQNDIEALKSQVAEQKAKVEKWKTIQENSGVDLSQWVHPSILKKNNSRNMLQRSVGALPTAGSSSAMLPGQASSVMAGALSGQYVPQPTVGRNDVQSGVGCPVVLRSASPKTFGRSASPTLGSARVMSSQPPTNVASFRISMSGSGSATARLSQSTQRMSSPTFHSARHPAPPSLSMPLDSRLTPVAQQASATAAPQSRLSTSEAAPSSRPSLANGVARNQSMRTLQTSGYDQATASLARAPEMLNKVVTLQGAQWAKEEGSASSSIVAGAASSSAMLKPIQQQSLQRPLGGLNTHGSGALSTAGSPPAMFRDASQPGAQRPLGSAGSTFQFCGVPRGSQLIPFGAPPSQPGPLAAPNATGLKSGAFNTPTGLSCIVSL